MSVIDTIKALLSDAGTPFAAVSGATSFAAARAVGPKGVPAAYVFFGREVSGDNQRSTGPVLQRTERDLSVVIVIDNAGDALGDAGSDELEAVKTFVRGQLIGAVIEAETGEPVTHVEGAVADTENGRIWFEDVFSLPTYTKEAS